MDWLDKIVKEQKSNRRIIESIAGKKSAELQELSEKEDWDENIGLQTGHSAFFKKKKDAHIFAEINHARIKKTRHTLNGNGWLVYK